MATLISDSEIQDVSFKFHSLFTNAYNKQTFFQQTAEIRVDIICTHFILF